MAYIPLTSSISSSISGRINPIRIILIDDQVSILEHLKAQIDSTTKLKVVASATHGQLAIDLVAQHLPDIAVIDIEMPRMNGLEIAKKLFALHHSIKVIFLSSYSQPAYIRQALQIGATGYLIKGTSADELIHAIEYVSEGYLQLGPGLFESMAIDLSKDIQKSDSNDKQSEVLARYSAQADEVILNRGGIIPVYDGVQELIEALPQLWSRILLYSLLIFLSIVIPWAALSSIDETGTASGKLETLSPPLKIESSTEGAIKNIRAKEGDTVKKGQVLIEVDSDALKSELEQLESRMRGQLANLDSLNQLKQQNLQTIQILSRQKEGQNQEKQIQISQNESSIQSLERLRPIQLAEKLAQLNSAKEQLSGANNKLIHARKRLQTDENNLRKYQLLVSQGVIAKNKLEELEGIIEDRRLAINQAYAEVQQAKANLDELDKSYQRLDQQLQSEIDQGRTKIDEQKTNQSNLARAADLELIQAQDQRKDIDSKIVSLQSEVTIATAQVKELNQKIAAKSIRATHDGVLADMPFQSTNTYIQVGQLVARIAPLDSPLILRALISTQDSGFLKAGMKVRVKISAYKFQDYGSISGKITRISPDVKQLETPQGISNQYVLEIELDENCILTQDKKCIPFRPGQEAIADIVIRQRRIISYFLDPIKKLQRGDFKL